MTAYADVLERVAQQTGYIPRGRDWQKDGRCPAHEDHSPSLSIGRGDDGRVLIACRAGCPTDAILEALGMTTRDLFHVELADGRGPAVVAEYRYVDERGELLFVVERRSPKGFRQRRPDGRGGWVWKLGDTRRVLYRLPEVLAAAASGNTVYVAEGEKDVHALELAGVVATCNPAGAGKWRPEYGDMLRDAHVVIVADVDEAGRQHARQVLADLTGKAASVRIVEPATGKDAADHLSAGGRVEDLVDVAPHDLSAPATADDREFYQAQVAEEARRLRVRADADRIVRQERAGALPPPSLTRLDEFLAIPDEPETYRVAEIMPAASRVVLAAQWKAGKTTMRDNLVRALVDGEPFLGRFPVTPFAGRVVILDDELSERMLRRWLRTQDIVNQDRVVVEPLRGRVASLDLLDPERRALWATTLRQHEAAVLVLDCLRPALDALGLSEDKDAGRFLVAFDALLAEAGVQEGVIVHHMGHSGERSRGASQLRDWPDVEWRLLREKDDDGEARPDARRYFSAYGRDVDLPEGLLDFDPLTKRLTLSGGTRRDTAADAAIPDVLAYLRGNPGASGRSIEEALGTVHKREIIRKAVRRGAEQGSIDTSEGPRRAVLHFANDQCAECADSAPASPSECASAPIEGALHSLDVEDPSAPPRTQLEMGAA